MRSKTCLAALALAALVVFLPGCSDPPTAPSDININITNNNTNNNGQPGPTASPSPGVGALDHVKVTQFGENCPSGSGPATWVLGGSPIVHVGCTAVITCSPQDSANKDVPNPPDPDLFGLIGGDPGTVSVAASGSNPSFNRDVKALKVGFAIFACTVSSKGSGPWSLPVVQ